MSEEVGSMVRVRPLGTVHVQSFHYDASVQYMVGLFYLLAYVGGQVQPGDDMLGSRYWWWSLKDVMDPSCRIRVPQKWILTRAVELYRLWIDCEVELQPALGSPT